MNLIKIQVFQPDRINAGKDKLLFQRVIETAEGLDFDFKTVTKSFEILFPKDVIIQFTLLTH